MISVASAAAPVPPLASHQVLVLLLQVAVLLLVASLLGRLAGRLGQAAIVGEMLTGVLLGPTVLGRLAPGLEAALLPPRPDQAHLLDAIGELGLLLLVGFAGTHLDLSLVRREGRTASRVAALSIAMTLAAGTGVGYALARRLGGANQSAVTVALFIGVAMSVTAIPVLAKLLADLDLTHREIGQLILACAVIGDTIGWLLLSVVEGMVGSRSLSITVLMGHVLIVVGFVAAAFPARMVLRAVVRATENPRAGQRAATSMIAVVTVVILLVSAAAQALGLDASFGAFVAGILVGSCPDLDPARLAPLRTVTLSVLAPLFLATAGLRADLGTLASPGAALAGLLVLVVAVCGKFGGAFLGGLWSGRDRWECLAVGAGVDAGGVVQIVIASVGLRLGVLSVAGYTDLIGLAVLTSVIASPLLRLVGARIAPNAAEQERRLRLARWSTAPAAASASAPERVSSLTS